MNNKNICQCYIVAYIDVLGQREIIRELENIEFKNDSRTIDKIIGIHSKTIFVIDTLRMVFNTFHTQFTKEKGPNPKIPEDQQDLYKKISEVNWGFHYLSDTVVIHGSLQSNGLFAPGMNNIYSIFAACGGALLLSIGNMKTCFRAAVDIGRGIELENGEVYGPGLIKAYDLEKDVANYPRIVIGNGLLTYLEGWRKGYTPISNMQDKDKQACQEWARKLLSTKTEDVDGVSILDYLGINFRELYDNYRQTEEQINYKETFRQALQFIREEYIRNKNSGNSKLSLRYFMLFNYFSSKQSEILCPK